MKQTRSSQPAVSSRSANFVAAQYDLGLSRNYSTTGDHFIEVNKMVKYPSSRV